MLGDAAGAGLCTAAEPGRRREPDSRVPPARLAGLPSTPLPSSSFPPWFLRPRPPAAWRGLGAAAAGVCPGFPGSAAHRRLAPTPARGAPAEPADKERQLAQPSTRHHTPGPGARAGTRLPSWDPVVRLSPPPFPQARDLLFLTGPRHRCRLSGSPAWQRPVGADAGVRELLSWELAVGWGRGGARRTLSSLGGDPAWKGRVGAEVEGAGPTGTG